jgi:putative phosphoribosyl transferase
MLFRDRYDAALKLIPYLKKYRNETCVIMAIPRGGVPIGYYIAKYFNFPLEILLTKKIGHPWNAELAIGAVSIEDSIIDTRHSIPAPYITNAIKQIRESLIERYKKFMGNREPIDIRSKTVIVVDDGIATGNTVLASIKILQKRQPKQIVIAVPVAPEETAKKIGKEVADFVCPDILPDFTGVGMYYINFSEVSDAEVIQLLKESNRFEHIVEK